MSVLPYRPNPLTPEGRRYQELHDENERLRARIAELTSKECPKCEGFGSYRSKPCSLCDGSGKVTG